VTTDPAPAESSSTQVRPADGPSDQASPHTPDVAGHWIAIVAVPPGEDAEVVAAHLWQAGALGLRDRGRELEAWFERGPDGSDPTEAVPGIGTDVAWRFEPTVDHLEAWRRSATPVAAGLIDIVPHHHAGVHDTAPGRHRILLDPGQAFGSGHHATTAGCLDAMADADLAGRSVLDVGTGTGVLAMAAVLQGGDPVVGVDTDPEAVSVAGRNAADNDLHLDLRVGSVSDVDGHWDVVLANLLTHTLVALAGDLHAATAPGGLLIASGVGTPRAGTVADALATAGYVDVDVRTHGDWVVLIARRPRDGTDGTG